MYSQSQEPQSQQQSYTYGVSAPAPKQEIKKEEKLYDIDEDEWQPSVWILVLIGSLVCALAAGIGVGIYFAIENKDKTPSPTTIPSVPPTIAPTPTPEPYVCDVCGPNSTEVVTIPNTIVNVQGEAYTCIDLQVQGLDSKFTEDICEKEIQTADISDACGCTASPTTSPTLSSAPTNEGQTVAPIFQCPICGNADFGISLPDATIEFPGISGDSITCGEVQTQAENGLIDPNTCFDGALTGAVELSCGCVFQCNLCGSNSDNPQAIGQITNPDGIVELPLGQPSWSCSSLQAAAEQGSITVQQCELLQPFVVDPCVCVYNTILV
jgi:hypothetical protein